MSTDEILSGEEKNPFLGRSRRKPKTKIALSYRTLNKAVVELAAEANELCEVCSEQPIYGEEDVGHKDETPITDNLAGAIFGAAKVLCKEAPFLLNITSRQKVVAGILRQFATIKKSYRAWLSLDSMNPKITDGKDNPRSSIPISERVNRFISDLEKIELELEKAAELAPAKENIDPPAQAL